jgi:predicted HTH transcriptional regulator
MDAIELLELVSLGETSTVQFKRTVDTPDQLAAELCAFANTSGGRLLIGVENDGTIGGLDPQTLRKVSSLVADVASNSIREPLYPLAEVVRVEGKNVLVVMVTESESKPHFDRQGAIWVKNMSDKRRVTSREELRRLFQDSHFLYADEQPVNRTSLADLDRPLLEEFLRKEYARSLPEGEELATLLNNLNVARGGNLTLAGLLFFGRAPQQFRPELVLKAVAFRGNSVTDSHYLDSEDFAGTLPGQLAQVLSFLQRNLRKIQNGKSFNTEGDWEVPREVFEELVVNLLVHRNYFITASSKVFVFANRIELHSPGTLPNALTIEQIKLGSSISRNPVLVNLASKLLPYRGIGSGVRRALEFHPGIEFVNDLETNSFRAVIARPPQPSTVPPSSPSLTDT